MTSPHRGAGYAIATALRPHCAWLVASISTHRWSFARSRLYDRVFKLSPPSDTWIASPESPQAREHAARLAEFCSLERIDVLWPSNDAELFAVVRNRQLFDSVGTRLAAPSFDSLVNCADKYSVLQAAQSVGFPVMPAIACESVDSASDWLQAHRPPYVVKSRWSTNSNGVALCLNEKKALAAASDLIARGQSAILQEYIPGNKEVSLHFLLGPGGEPLTEFALRKLRHLAPSYSTAVQVEAMPKELDMAPRLLQRLGLTGFCVVQTRFDERDRKHKLIEINARFGTNSRILFAMSPDLAWLSALVAAGRGLEVARQHAEAIAVGIPEMPPIGGRGGSPIEDVLSFWSLLLAKLDRSWAAHADFPGALSYMHDLILFYLSGAKIDLHTRALRADPLAALPYFAGLARFVLPTAKRRRALRLIPWGGSGS